MSTADPNDPRDPLRDPLGLAADAPLLAAWLEWMRLAEAGQLAPILESWEIPPTPVHLVHAGRGRLPLKMRLFLDLAVARLRTVLDAIQSRMPAL